MQDNVRQVQEAVNVMAAVLKNNAALVRALEQAYIQIKTLREGLGPHSFRVTYPGANPVKYTELADKALNAITEAIAK